jgi:hypothetical protein
MERFVPRALLSVDCRAFCKDSQRRLYKVFDIDAILHKIAATVIASAGHAFLEHHCERSVVIHA